MLDSNAARSRKTIGQASIWRTNTNANTKEIGAWKNGAIYELLPIDKKLRNAASKRALCHNRRTDVYVWLHLAYLTLRGRRVVDHLSAAPRIFLVFCHSLCGWAIAFCLPARGQ